MEQEKIKTGIAARRRHIIFFCVSLFGFMETAAEDKEGDHVSDRKKSEQAFGRVCIG